MNEVENINEDTNVIDPVVMVVSPYSNIGNRLRHFAGAIVDESEADKYLITIDCYSKEVDGSNLQVIRLSDANGMWTEIHPLDKVSGTLLPESVTVNLFDLYNAIDNCPDELLSFWIDEEDNELVLNSFLNEVKEIDELEIRFKIISRGHSTSLLESQSLEQVNKLGTITLNASMYTTVMSELNVEYSADGVNIIINDGKLKFQTEYHGFTTELRVKELEDELYENDFSTFIPFNVFKLMISTGHVYDLKLNVYENHVLTLSTDDYEFYYRIEDERPIINVNMDDAERYFIIDRELIEDTTALLNRLSKSAQISNLTIEYVSDGEADISTSLEGRWSISIRTDLAMLSKETIEIDADIFQEMVSRTHVDAIQLSYIDVNHICMKVENARMEKVMHYDHAKFSSYRKEKYLEWKNND